MSAGDLIDRARLRMLLEYDDPEQSMVRGLIDTFLRDAPGYLEALREAHARRDYEQVAHHAHALKGAASNAAARALSEAVSRLEALAQAGDGKADSVTQIIATLPETYGRTAAALAAERERLGNLVANR
jgi:HPt (histidine-containing phosphotransfer) domain-containing protein